jgi:Family of unknown function (DUF6301)
MSWKAASAEQVAGLIRAWQEVHWSWGVTEVDRLVSPLGWRTGRRSEHRVELDTGLDVGGGYGSVLFHGGRISRLTVRVCDVADEEDLEARAFLRDAFAGTVRAATQVLGPPTAYMPGAIPEVRWRFAPVTVRVEEVRVAVNVVLAETAYVDWEDESERILAQRTDPDAPALPAPDPAGRSAEPAPPPTRGGDSRAGAPTSGHPPVAVPARHDVTPAPAPPPPSEPLRRESRPLTSAPAEPDRVEPARPEPPRPDPPRAEPSPADLPPLGPPPPPPSPIASLGRPAAAPTSALGPAPAPQADSRRRPPPGVEPSVMQKVVPHHLVVYYLDDGYDRVAGYVYRWDDVRMLETPAQLFEALGLSYAGSSFTAGDPAVHVIRWPAHGKGFYRTPYGGIDEAGMRSIEGWVIERPPFMGNGFAPGKEYAIPEWKVDSVRLPHGAEMWRIEAGGEQVLVAAYDADSRSWKRALRQSQ